jgi:hypothetical protein
MREDRVWPDALRCQCPTESARRCRNRGDLLKLPSGAEMRLCESHSEFHEYEIRQRLENAWRVAYGGEVVALENIGDLLLGLWAGQGVSL